MLCGNQKVGKLLIVKISNINIVGFFPCSEAIHFLLKRIQLFSAWLYFMGWHLASGVWENLEVLLFKQPFYFQLSSALLLSTVLGFSSMELLPLHFPRDLGLCVVRRKGSCLDSWERRWGLGKVQQLIVQLVDQYP